MWGDPLYSHCAFKINNFELLLIKSDPDWLKEKKLPSPNKVESWSIEGDKASILTNWIGSIG